jgi:hypothetical protein
MNEFN